MLARAGFLVLVPDIANLRALEVRSGDVRHVADAVRYLARCAGAGAIGLVGIPYAAGPALIAALENDIRDRIGFVVTVGGYYDGVAMLTYLPTGYLPGRPDEAWRAGRRGDRNERREGEDVSSAVLSANRACDRDGRTRRDDPLRR